MLAVIGVLNHLVNPIVRAILRSPAHRLLSGSVMLLTYTGSRTGRRHTLPVMYARTDDGLLVNVGMAHRKRWWRNLREGAPVELLVQGAAARGFADVIAGDEARASFERFIGRFPRASRAPEASGPVMVRICIDGEFEQRG